MVRLQKGERGEISELQRVSKTNTVTMLPLRPASLTHKIPPKTQNNLWYASRRMQRSIDRSEDVFAKCVTSMAVLVAVV